VATCPDLYWHGMGIPLETYSPDPRSAEHGSAELHTLTPLC